MRIFGKLSTDSSYEVQGTEKNERPTSNVQHRTLNKVFCQFINWQSCSDFIIRCSTFPPESFGGFNVGRSSVNMSGFRIRY